MDLNQVTVTSSERVKIRNQVQNKYLMFAGA